MFFPREKYVPHYNYIMKNLADFLECKNTLHFRTALMMYFEVIEDLYDTYGPLHHEVKEIHDTIVEILLEKEELNIAYYIIYKSKGVDYVC